MDAESIHHIGAVALDCVDAQVEPLRDFLARTTFGTELHDLALTGGKDLERVMRSR
jgi:hypothetical protein